eukprot:CAMPEP_0182498244 /NCGR_PEP_ID=MMETSP1321-20130603/6499_1 /TAXON_ID=91990 /ORGANISM="Bolidomonas sp., Strain RCC1657" /LENGTH=136 /DNA_ID=CAMNT_0024702275 /DNA_START=55 /DNA_END=462 /DNA_ORIENTATION=-
MSAIVNKVMGTMARAYRANVAKSLNSYGLHYEDCLLEKPSVLEAISLSSPEVLRDRNRRIKRAMDLSFKKKDLNDYRPDIVENATPFKKEISELVQKIEEREEERELINKGGRRREPTEPRDESKGWEKGTYGAKG